MSRQRRRKQRARREENARAGKSYIDFETRGLFNPANGRADDLVAVYFEEAGQIKRVSYGPEQFAELYKTNPQLATYAAGMFDVPWTRDYHIAELLNDTSRSTMDLGTEIHRQIEQGIMLSGDMLTGEPHTNTATQAKADYVEIEKRIAEYYSALWYREFVEACYGVNRPEKKVAKPLDTGREPAKSFVTIAKKTDD